MAGDRGTETGPPPGDAPPAETEALERWTKEATRLRDLVEDIEDAIDEYPHDPEARATVEHIINEAPHVCDDLRELSIEVEEAFNVK